MNGGTSNAAKETDKTMSDILFQPNLDSDLFNVKDFYSNAYFSEGLNRVDLSNVFKVTPAKIYAEIREIAQARFDHQLPDQKKLNCLSSTLQKASLLRDLSRALGV